MRSAFGATTRRSQLARSSNQEKEDLSSAVICCAVCLYTPYTFWVMREGEEEEEEEQDQNFRFCFTRLLGAVMELWGYILRKNS